MFNFVSMTSKMKTKNKKNKMDNNNTKTANWCSPKKQLKYN